MFASRGRLDAKELADQTIDRVFVRFAQLKQTYVGDPASYFYRVAHLVLLESQRASARMMPEAVPEIEAASADEERAHIEACGAFLKDVQGKFR
ncbi:MAG TPA: hypothetical protein DC047_18250 [Blastocatellia bacterium]|nr:hypothetical protein [Blastocatellia bacterium]